MKGKYLRMLREVEFGPYPQVDSLIRQGREVARKHSLLTVAVAFALAALAGLGAALARPSVTVTAAQATAGSYVISCLMEPLGQNQEPCLTGNQIPVGTALVLNAHVTDSSGNLATIGSLIFQDCLLNGVPAQSIQCDSGSGVWSDIQRVHIKVIRNQTPEDIRVGYGSPSAPQTIGFRFRYLNGQASGIANGISNSMDVTWVQQ